MHKIKSVTFPISDEQNNISLSISIFNSNALV